MSKAVLHDYQARLAEFVRRTPYCALFLEMGMGKSLTTLSALETIPDTGNVLVIAPVNIARSVWADEIDKWGIAIRHSSLIVGPRGGKLNREKRHQAYDDALMSREARMYFISRDLVADLVDYLRDNAKRNAARLRLVWPDTDPAALETYARWPFPTVVIDEAQSFKSATSVRFKKLKSVRPMMRRVIELSGTPTPQGMEDLWAEMWLLDMGQRLGRTLTQYRTTYFRPGAIISGRAVNWQVIPEKEPLIHRAVSDICVSMKNTSLKLPDVTYADLTVHMSPAERKLYDSMRKDLVVQLPDGEVTAANGGVLMARLSQMASGAIYLDESHEYSIIHEQKLDMLSYLVRNEPSPILVAYHFRSDLAMILARMEAEGIDARAFDGSPQMIRDWNEGRIRVMLIQPASAGHGLNLQRGGHVLAWYTLPWSLEEYLQTNARLHRQGQTRPVMIYHIMCDRTVDARIRRALANKSLAQDKLLETVRMELGV